MGIDTKASFFTKPPFLANLDRLICSYWLPAGFFIFLIAFFLAPNQHYYKIIVTDLLLLPALFASLTPSARLTALRQNPALILVVIYLFYMAANTFLRRTQDKAEFVQWGAYILLFLVAIGARMRITTQRLQQLLISAALVAAGAGLFTLSRDLHSGAFYHREYRLEGYGALYNPLRSGELFGAFSLIGAWAVLSINSKLMRGLAFSAAAICFITVLLTGSRSPLVALLAAGLCATLLEKNRTRRLLWRVLLGAITSAVAILCWSELSARGTSLRPEIWWFVLRLCLQHLWFGVGLDAPLTIPVSVGVTFVNDPHNVFLAALFYGGIFGLLLFIAAFFTSGLLAWRMRHHSTLATLASMLQLYGLATLQFDGGCLISRPNDFWVLYWMPIALYLRVASGAANDKTNIAL